MWCTLKEFLRINSWAQGYTPRYLRKLIAQERLPFQSRSNISPKNTRRYEVFVKKPSEIALLLHLRKKEHHAIQDTKKEAPESISQNEPRNRVFVTLPKEMASLIRIPGYHAVIAEKIREYIHCENQKQETSYQNIRLDMSAHTFQLIRKFAKSNGLPVAKAAQIIFDNVLTNGQNPKNTSTIERSEP
ncbi:MAG: hypothetical protein K0B01_07775 [Syntrophobacterales bacterium]|nr:hypothetical protein [Syntrophobacterales bacterium]